MTGVRCVLATGNVSTGYSSPLLNTLLSLDRNVIAEMYAHIHTYSVHS